MDSLNKEVIMAVTCPRCGGDGTIMCETCSGHGQYQLALDLHECGRCNGTGELQCPNCSGTGEIDTD